MRNGVDRNSQFSGKLSALRKEELEKLARALHLRVDFSTFSKGELRSNVQMYLISKARVLQRNPRFKELYTDNDVLLGKLATTGRTTKAIVLGEAEAQVKAKATVQTSPGPAAGNMAVQTPKFEDIVPALLLNIKAEQLNILHDEILKKAVVLYQTPSMPVDDQVTAHPLQMVAAQYRYPSGEYFIWLDLETTDAICPVEQSYIMEIAVKITDENLQQLDKGLQILVHYNDMPLQMLHEKMPNPVRAMHNKSGLIREYLAVEPKDRISLTRADALVCAYLRMHGIQPRQGLLAGAGIGYDRNMIRAHMPSLNGMLHYSVFDTTTLWQLVRRKYGRRCRFANNCAHRAMADIDGAIRETRFYSQVLFKNDQDIAWPSPHYTVP